MPNRKQILLHLAAILLFAVAAMSSSFYNGLTGGNDMHQHFQFAQTIHDSVRSGEIYPSFAAAPNLGYGDVGLRFYPPFGYYVLAIFFLIIGNWYWASLAAFTAIFFIGGVGVYLWAREEFSAAQSLLAAALYTFAPHHLNQIYNNFLYAEFVASAVVPFCFLFLTRVCQKGKIQDIFGLSISYALLILTHLPLTIIGSIIFGVYALTLLEKKSVFKTLLKLQISVATALAASSFYWLRMATELSLVKHSAENYFSSIYDYRENFLFTPQNIINFSTDSSTLWLADLMLFAVLLVSIPSIIFCFRERKNLSRFTISTAIIFFVAVFMTTPLSKFIWDNFSLLQKVQFPWRWLEIVSASAAIFASIGIIRASETMKQSKNLLLPIGLGIIFLVFVTVSAFITKEAAFLTPDKFNRQIEDVKNSPSFECWWTIWAKPDALQQSEKIIADGRNYEIKNWQPLNREIIIAAGKPAAVRVATFYYPHWQATVNGERVSAEADESGALTIPISANESKIQLVFREPYFVKAANFVSLTVWLLFGFGIIMSLGKVFPEFNSSEEYRA